MELRVQVRGVGEGETTESVMKGPGLKQKAG